MLKTVFLKAFSLIWLLNFGLIYGSERLSVEAQKQIERGIDKTYRMDFQNAISCFDSTIKDFPERPEGYFFKSANYFWQTSVNLKDEDRIEKFRINTELTIEKAEELEETKDLKFFLGASYGNLGRYHALKANWIRAYWYGKKGKNYLEELVEMDSTYYDAYLGLGIFHYYADILPSFVKVLSGILGVKGDRERGLYELKLAAEKGTYSRVEAIYILTDLYVDLEGEYTKAEQLCHQIQKEFPQNYGFLYNLGKAYQFRGEANKAIAVYSEMISRIDTTLAPEIYIVGYYQKAETYASIDEYENAIKAYETLRNFPYSQGTWQGLWGKLRLGEAYEILGQREKAVEIYKQVEDSDKFEKPRKEAKRRIKNPMSELEILSLRTTNLEQGEKHQKVVKLSEEYFSKNPKIGKDQEELFGEVHYRLGKSYTAIENYGKAKTTFEKVLKFDKVSSARKGWAYFFLGKVNYILGNDSLAKENFQKSLKEDTTEWLLVREIEKIYPNFFKG
ncbi:MAG: DUF3808 domain-containing protein [Calditrichaeota bacterium]|nr:MAG: DUF3808 domain-containing protein [Calditrichota bacterium]